MRPPFFSVDCHQANLQPNLLLFNFPLRFNPIPSFPEITFDCTLSFSKRVSSPKAKFFLPLMALRFISASSWDPSKKSISLFCIKLFFGPFSLMLHPDCFLSVTNTTKSERLHRVASPAITGCFSSSHTHFSCFPHESL